ncbi:MULTISPECIES: phosphatidylinositol phosphate synthase [Corynebacterium]|uniref:Phosphatidylinositol phosphate synthase n=2 Tax=Corynebacterium TaxID=1716 RepID=A0A2N6TMA6_9CORY|nr:MULTISPECIES: CDP-alcohol phosphatidyltransferase family protein [Corynebacterium]KKO80051.1 phosphatidylglycerophosphate synthase [Corynebacterium minutissimum]MTD91404.1 CDP-alcohol phosphatidyltransferase family protein [Corynebacterium aurimucosum]OFK65063.1 phosphatidylglycerophosphate synthase [Corynebacterium sp. HMSC074A09]OFK68449.1 phosphatidylglycerophosphate synthase [Corynebacterium sp. HMSC076G08]OFN36116.1 phosphatidylglycerophosphate synthase [Corynebacterium sp. HMSC072A04]
MLSVHGRKPAAVVVVPVAKLFLKMGLTPNIVTIVGTIVTIAISVILIPLDHLFAAALLSGLFAAFDMLDGTMARLTTGGSNFGATLDASCDRITDGALFAAIAFWMVYVDNAHPLNFAACMVVLVSSQVISYVKARGEASGFKMVGGLVERPERLILGLGGVGLEGLGVPYALEVSLWLLAVGSVFTIYQRMRQAARQDTKARFKKDL